MPRDSSTPLRSVRNDLSAVLLAGGESRRMGTDKATFLFRGKPLWQVQLETLRKLRPAEIFLSARTDPSWRPDDVTVHRGHSAIMRTAQRSCRIHESNEHDRHLLALAIDMPWMSRRITFDSFALQIEPGRGVVAKIDDRAEPLAAIYPREAAIDFAKALAGSDFSLQSLVRHLVASGKLRAISVTEQEEKRLSKHKQVCRSGRYDSWRLSRAYAQKFSGNANCT